MKRVLLIAMLLPMLAQAQTLEECSQAAERNYPLIKQYGLIEKTTQLTMDNIQRGWLPKVSVSAQATYQSDVPAWPDNMQTLLQQMNVDAKGLRKDQYRVGVDVSQTVFDGGAISSQKELTLRQGMVQEAENEVNLYAVRKRVNELYFSLLLLDAQITLKQDLRELLASNERKLASMLKKGTAAESDYNSVCAERLSVDQQLISLQSQRRTLQSVLSAFCGMEVTQVSKPVPVEMKEGNRRPELRLADAQLRLADAQEKWLKSRLLPQLSVFASGYYGYPGYNMFEDMMRHRWSLNGMVGARLTWNIGAFYTHGNDRAKVKLQREMAENGREVFLFNSRMEQMQQQESIDRYRKLMADDEEIILLRQKVRKAAESRLAHGIIDVNDLVREINNENAAKVQQSIHEIEMLKEQYDLKFTTNF